MKGYTKGKGKGRKFIPTTRKKGSIKIVDLTKEPLTKKGLSKNDKDKLKEFTGRKKQHLDPTQDDFESDPKVEKMIVELDEAFPKGFPQSIPQIREFFAKKKYSETEINRLVGNLRNLGFSFDDSRNKQKLKLSDPMCTQCGRHQKTKGKCEYCGCKGSYC